MKFFVCLFLFFLNTMPGSGQRLYYADTDKGEFANHTVFAAGQSGDEILVWTFNKPRKTLTVKCYNSRMQLQRKTVLKTAMIIDFRGMSVFHQGEGKEVVVQYWNKTQSVAQVFSYDTASNLILAGNILHAETIDAFALVFYSDNNKYTAFTRLFNTRTDSVLMQYAVYNRSGTLVKSVAFELPDRYDKILLDRALLDTAGNFFFAAIKQQKEPMTSETLSIHGISIVKDSLLTGNFTQDGHFANVAIQQNTRNGTISVSGFFWQEADQTRKLPVLKDLFITTFDEDLVPKTAAAFYAVNEIANSNLHSLTLLSTGALALYRDSGFLFYSTGFSKIITMRGNFFTRPNLPSIPTIPDYRPTPQATLQSSYHPIYWNPNPYGGEDHSFSDMDGYYTKVQGNRFFMTARLTKNGIGSTAFYTDSLLFTPDIDDDFSTLTAGSIHYIISKPEVKETQTVYDLIYTNDQLYKLMPVVTKTGIRIFLRSGIMLSQNQVLFQAIDKRNYIHFVNMILD